MDTNTWINAKMSTATEIQAEPQPWDHKIEMKDTFVPKPFKTYNLTPEEQVELDKFLKENLEKGYI